MNKSKLREQIETGGGYFQFANEEEVKKFIIWLKLLDKEHEDALENQRKAILEEVRSKIIGNDEPTPKIITKGSLELVKKFTRNELREEIRQKLSLLEDARKT